MRYIVRKMKKVDKEQVSRYRQSVQQKTTEIKYLSLKAGYEDPLLAGTPVRTFKTCGKATCRCARGGEFRHGPYLAVQIKRDGKQRNLTLTKSEADFFEMAIHYQKQMENRRKIIALQTELLAEIDKMLEARIIWDKK